MSTVLKFFKKVSPKAAVEPRQGTNCACCDAELWGPHELWGRRRGHHWHNGRLDPVIRESSWKRRGPCWGGRALHGEMSEAKTPRKQPFVLQVSPPTILGHRVQKRALCGQRRWLHERGGRTTFALITEASLWGQGEQKMTASCCYSFPLGVFLRAGTSLRKWKETWSPRIKSNGSNVDLQAPCFVTKILQEWPRKFSPDIHVPSWQFRIALFHDLNSVT